MSTPNYLTWGADSLTWGGDRLHWGFEAGVEESPASIQYGLNTRTQYELDNRVRYRQ